MCFGVGWVFHPVEITIMMMQAKEYVKWFRHRLTWRWTLVVLFIVICGSILLMLPAVRQALSWVMAWAGDEAAIEAWVLWLGWLGPPMLILLHALQIVFAPLPAYALFGAAGFLYGPWWGGSYAMVGTLLGATAAMVLTRRFGRPLAVRMVGEARLDKWSQMTINQSWLTWGFLLLAPVGDLPYFLAGLSQISVWRILLLTLLIRVPTIFLIAAAASGTTSLTWQTVVPLMVVVVFGCGLLFRYQSAIQGWLDRMVYRRFNPPSSPEQPQNLNS